jgi:hypothetical protein
LAGHKDAQMMAQYSHANQVIDFAAIKKKMEKSYSKTHIISESNDYVAGGNK